MDEEEEKEVKKEKVWDWELINKEKALWLRSPGDITDEEYQNLYSVLTKVFKIIIKVLNEEMKG